MNLTFPLRARFSLLPGTLRGRLLAARRVRERVVRLDELKGRRIWLGNSVRGWQAAELVDDLPSPEVR